MTISLEDMEKYAEVIRTMQATKNNRGSARRRYLEKVFSFAYAVYRGVPAVIRKRLKRDSEINSYEFDIRSHDQI